MSNINQEVCYKAMKDINVKGYPLTEHSFQSLIEQAIKSIQTDGRKAMLTRYFGIKNYAGFGDQQEDHEYGYGPRHGHIVFSIGRVDNNKCVELGKDHIYLLECVRDFGFCKIKDKKYNLQELLRKKKELEYELSALNMIVNKVEVETHV